MKIHSISTPHGAALLANLDDLPVHQVESPPGWGLIFWGRCDRATFAQIILASKAEWIADYLIKEQCAIVVFSSKREVALGSRFEFDTSNVDALCPKCGSTNYISNNRLNWLCKDCGRQWRKHVKRVTTENVKDASDGLIRAVQELDTDQYLI